MYCISYGCDLLSLVILHSCSYSYKENRCTNIHNRKSPGKGGIASVSAVNQLWSTEAGVQAGITNNTLPLNTDACNCASNLWSCTARTVLYCLRCSFLIWIFICSIWPLSSHFSFGDKSSWKHLKCTQ